MNLFLKKVKEIGYSGVQNFPTVGLFEGRMRQTFEETGMSYNLEVEMVHIAHEMDLFSSPYAFNPEEAVKMTKAGADVVVAHCGCTVGGSIGAETIMELDAAVKVVQEIHNAAVAERSDVIVLCHGGPISSPRMQPTYCSIRRECTASTEHPAQRGCRWRQPSSSISRNLRT